MARSASSTPTSRPSPPRLGTGLASIEATTSSASWHRGERPLDSPRRRPLAKPPDGSRRRRGLAAAPRRSSSASPAPRRSWPRHSAVQGQVKVEVELAGQVLTSAGAEATDAFGVLPTVHCVSVRRGDYLGWLSSYLVIHMGHPQPRSSHSPPSHPAPSTSCASVRSSTRRRSSTCRRCASHSTSPPQRGVPA
jgi:hypothetical protein